LACAALWENTSPALYRQILQEGLLTLPGRRHLQDLSASFTVDVGISSATEEYLKKRMISLQPRELLVNLMIDEVYTCKRVEYSGGSFFGY
jgi:hypothetical protein